MVVLLVQVQEAAKLLNVQNITVFGIMLFVISLLIIEKERTEKKNERDKARLLKTIKEAREELRNEFKETNEDLKKITEKYHIFTIQVFEKLNSIVNNK